MPGAMGTCLGALLPMVLPECSQASADQDPGTVPVQSAAASRKPAAPLPAGQSARPLRTQINL